MKRPSAPAKSLSWGLLLSVSCQLIAQPAPDAFMGMGLDGINYWSSTPFANTCLTGSSWNEVDSAGSSVRVHIWDNPQFDPSTLLPKYLNPGRFLRMYLFPLNANYYNRPNSWPLRSGVGLGRVLVAWTGNADIRLGTGSFLAGESSGPATGQIANGRRMYQLSGSTGSLSVEIHAVDSAQPPSSLKVWLPDPSSPGTATLEGQFWHPLFLERLRDMPLRFLRFMDWGATNGSPQMNWSDRRLPTHVMQTGTLNRREPAAGFGGDRSTGVAYEYMVQLANEVGTDLWVCIPHLADDLYIRKLARLIRYGSDGVEPYTTTQPSAVYPPLRPDLKVWIEFSNEIWSGGTNFPQGNWAEQQSAAQGLSKARFNARQFCRVWRIFQEEFEGTSRLVRVAALFTANSAYNTELLSEIASYGPTLSPPVTADVASPTTYFGNGIQDWAHQKAIAQAGGADPWFYTNQTFVSGSSERPVTIPMTSDYWTGSSISRHLAETFVEWKRRIFSGANLQGGGPDATGTGGGFDGDLPDLIASAFGRSLPIVSYEGGPSIYTDYLDGGDMRDDGITAFMEALNRSDGMAEILRIQLNMAFAKGLRHHGIFVGPSGSWGKFGQWGQLEFMQQNPATSPRWQTLLELNSDFASLRPVDDPMGSVPVFDTPSDLPGARAGDAFTRVIATSGGDGNRTLQLVGSSLLPGISAVISNSSISVSGTASTGGENFLYARVQDEHGDASWKVFRLYVGGGPGVVLESNFDGSNPALNLPWSSTWQLAANWTNAGWEAGTGIHATAGDNALHWSQDMPADEASSTLAHALSANATWSIALSPDSGAAPLDLRGARVRFSINRTGYHAPRRFALFTSISGFGEGQQLYESERIGSTNSTLQMEVELPSTPEYAAVSTPITFRLVGYGGQYSGHVVRLTEFRVSQTSTHIPPQLLENPAVLPPAHPSLAYTGSLSPLAFSPDPLTWSKSSGPPWLAVAADGSLSGSPSTADLGDNLFVAAVTDSSGSSSTLNFSILVSQVTAAPSFSLSNGSYAHGANLTLSTTTPGASIRYTLDGSLPTSTHGVLYSGPVTLPIGSYTLRAVAFRTGLADSTDTSRSYEIYEVSAPRIVSQPIDQSIAEGGTALFEVSAEGTQPLFYQWRRNGVALAGMTSPVLTLSGVSPSQAGIYDVVVSNAWGEATSASATLQVLSGPTTGRPILSLPKNRFSYVVPPYNLFNFLIDVENQGDQNLTWNATVANNGSSNYYSFRVNGPTAAGELDFNWRDITSPGTGGARRTVLETNDSETIALPWSFPFFGSNQTTATLSRFGRIHFGAEVVSGSNTNLPSASAPGNLVAVLWDNWQLDSQSSIWTRSSADEFVVTWKDVVHSGNSSRRAAFQGILFRDGRIRTQVLSLPATGITATVGVQNGSRTTGKTATYNNLSEIVAGTSITMGMRVAALSLQGVSTKNGTVPPKSLQQLEFNYSTNSASEPVGTRRTSYIVLKSNDPERPSEVIPVTLEVATVPWMQVYGQSSGGSIFRIPSGSALPTTDNYTKFTSSNQTYSYLSTRVGTVDLSYYGNPKVQVTGPHASDFELIEDLPENSSLGTSFKIRFLPNGPGVRSAQVRIENSSSESPYTFAIEGPGIPWLDYWRSQFNLPATGVGELTADPDGDKIPNLLEYALGGNPLVMDNSAILPKSEWVGNLLGLTFRQAPDPVLVYRVQYSEDLAAWQDIWIGTGEMNEEVLTTVTEPEPASASPRKFLRLRVNR